MLKVEHAKKRVKRAQKLGKPKDDGQETIIAKFGRHKFKQLILSNAISLKGAGFFINEDYCKEIVKIRKAKWKEVKQLQEQAKYAVLVYDRVV